ncbi:MAG: hypothetical protein QOD10_2528, partial [Mycobacterium sp.]|nr:hypothetical protein [Mycobacterium sp.]
MFAFEIFGWSISAETLVIGALTGLVYAVLGAGLVLVYRATRVINFAYGEIGAFGAAVLAKLVLDYRWNFFLALAGVLVVGGLLGAAVELLVVRRLFKAPRLILLVATIGVAQLVFVLQLVLPGVKHAARYPSPIPGTITVGNLVLRSEHFMVLAFVPIVIVGLGFLLTRTPYGIAIRASAENADRAELVGISTKRVSTLVWVLAGVLATLTAVLINPLRGTIVGLPSQALGPSLLLRALTAGLVGGLVSLPLTLLGGVIVGVVEAILFVNVSSPGMVDLVLFLAVLVLVLVRRGSIGAEESGSWSLTPKVKAIPERLREVWWVKRLNPLVGAFGVVVALLLPVVFDSSSQVFLFARVLIFAMVALSVTVLTGWGGQLSLGQFAFVGLGAMVTAALVDRGMPFGYAVGYATVAGVVAALLIGFPALRVRGLFLAVTTLAFAVAARGYILTHHTSRRRSGMALTFGVSDHDPDSSPPSPPRRTRTRTSTARKRTRSTMPGEETLTKRIASTTPTMTPPRRVRGSETRPPTSPAVSARRSRLGPSACDGNPTIVPRSGLISTAVSVASTPASTHT